MKYFKYLISGLLFIFGLTIINQAQTTEIKLDKNSGEIIWKGKKVTGKEHHGTISIKEGTLAVEDGELKNINVTIDMTTISNQDIEDKSSKKKLEGHLRSDDFFHVEKYTEAHFKSTSVVKSSKRNKYYIEGDLTIKGTTHPVEFDANFNTDKKSYVGSADITFDRSKYNIRYGSDSFFDDLGDNMIYDDIELNIELSDKL
ncbi:MAG: YceI family protein [Bacteroidales bacterium]|nr:YceI family protein [Bacteroidales bacterium]MCF8334734.1 YceI family protein [Bacteroidales bacterium]